MPRRVCSIIRSRGHTSRGQNSISSTAHPRSETYKRHSNSSSNCARPFSLPGYLGPGCGDDDGSPLLSAGGYRESACCEPARNRSRRAAIRLCQSTKAVDTRMVKTAMVSVSADYMFGGRWHWKHQWSASTTATEMEIEIGGANAGRDARTGRLVTGGSVMCEPRSRPGGY